MSNAPREQEEVQAKMAGEGTNFASAKNFWQTREAHAQSQAEAETPAIGSGSSRISIASAASSLPATFPNPATPNEKYPDQLEEEDQESESKTPPPAPSTGAAASALNRMTSFRCKFFTNSSTSSDAKATDKESDSSPSSSSALPSIPVPHLPDMSSWKEKMKMSRPTPPKMSFSFEKLSTQLKTSLGTATLAVSDADKAVAARNNIHRPTPQSHNGAKTASPTENANPYGELVVAEVLAARDLSAGDLFQGESDSYAVVKFQEWERRTEIIKNTKSPVFNERFVFWIPSSPDQAASEPPGLVSILLMNKNLVMTDEHLGEVHISLDVPLNQACDEWYPLVKENGEQQGHVRIGVRRMALTTTALQQAAQSLSAQNRSLNDDDLAMHGAVIPDLWYGFAEAAEPLEIAKVSQADVLATKLNDLSRRFIGIELTSTEVTADGQRRDIF